MKIRNTAVAHNGSADELAPSTATSSTSALYREFSPKLTRDWQTLTAFQKRSRRKRRAQSSCPDRRGYWVESRAPSLPASFPETSHSTSIGGTHLGWTLTRSDSRVFSFSQCSSHGLYGLRTRSGAYTIRKRDRLKEPPRVDPDKRRRPRRMGRTDLP